MPPATTTLTYEQLIEEMCRRVGSAGMPSASSFRNLKAALLALLRSRSTSAVSTIGSTLRVGYFKAMAAHVEVLSRESRDERYIANRKNALKHWRSLLLTLDREEAARSGSMTPLQAALHEAVGDRSLRAIAIEAAVPHATLKRWMAGATPQSNAGSHLRRLEEALGVDSGALSSLVRLDRPQPKHKTEEPIAYRARLSTQSRAPYRLTPANASDRLRKEWASLLRHKTSAASLSRLAASQVLATEGSPGPVPCLWRTEPRGGRVVPADAWIDTIDGRQCATARICFSHVAQYIGWLLLATENDGGGQRTDDADTLAWFASVSMLSRFVEWRVQRSGGVVSGGVGGFLQFVEMLCHPSNGWLTHQTAMALPSEKEPWTTLCARTRAYARTYRAAVKPMMTVARNPRDPIAHVLAMECPIDAFVDAVKRLDSNRPCTGGVTEAVWARDRLLLALSNSNPLRAKNLRELTWRSDNTGHLRQDATGGWRIFIPRDRFKNLNGAARDSDYDVVVQPSVWPYVERYLRDYRPMLNTGAIDLVFLSSELPAEPWKTLNRRYAELTRKYVKNCPGVGPQSARHVVATTIIKRTGNWDAAARALLDRRETVERSYAHLRTDDASTWLEKAAGDSFRTL